MIVAKDAKTKTYEAINDCATEELRFISTEIDRAIKEGKFSISAEGTIGHTTRHRLEELGYKVIIGSQYNQSYYKISWN